MSWFTALSIALQIMLRLLKLHDEAVQRGIGRAEALKMVEDAANVQIEAFDNAVIAARERHAANPNSDSAFDPEFRRDK